MSIPQTQLFEDFLAGSRVVPTRPERSFVSLASSHPTRQIRSECASLYIYYPSIDLSIRSVLRQINRSLTDSATPTDDEVAIAVLGLIVESRPPDRPAVQHANICLRHLVWARLIQSVVLPSQLDNEYRLQLGLYSTVRFDPEKILYWAERGRSAFPIDLHTLAGFASLERDPIEVLLIEWGAIFAEGPILKKWGQKIVHEVFLDTYYAAVARIFEQSITGHIKRDMLIYESAAMVSIDVESLIHSPFTKVVSLFQWKSTLGISSWALFSDVSIFHTNYPPLEAVPACQKWLEEELGFKQLNPEKPFDRGTEGYCRFLQRAHEHRVQGRQDEALLHFAIALDLLFGAEGRSSDSVAQRAAVMVFRQLATTLEDAVARIKRLYAIRSKYVHEGMGTSKGDLQQIEEICTLVLWSLLQCSAQATFIRIDEWLLKIDYVVAAIRSKSTILETEFLTLGIPPSGTVRRSPLRVEGGVQDGPIFH